MTIQNIPFGTTDWESIKKVEYKGERGSAFWRTKQCGNIRVRMVEYTAGYRADHWCKKGISCCVWKVSFTPSLKTVKCIY